MANSIICLSCGAIVSEYEIEKGTHRCKRVDYYDNLLLWLEKHREDFRLYIAREEMKAKLYIEKYGNQFVQTSSSITPEKLNALIEQWKKEKKIEEDIKSSMLPKRYDVNSSSYSTYTPEKYSEFKRSYVPQEKKQFSKKLDFLLDCTVKLFLNLVIVIGFGFLVRYGYLLFTVHSEEAFRKATIFIIGIIIWIIIFKLSRSRKYRRAKPSLKFTVFSILAIVVIFAFAGVEPFSAYKNNLLDKWKSYQIGVAKDTTKLDSFLYYPIKAKDV